MEQNPWEDVDEVGIGGKESHDIRRVDHLHSLKKDVVSQHPEQDETGENPQQPMDARLGETVLSQQPKIFTVFPIRLNRDYKQKNDDYK